MLLIALVIFSVLVYFLTARSLYSAVDEALEVNADQASAGANFEHGQLAVDDIIPNDAKFTELSDQGVTLRLLGEDGQIIRAVGPYHTLPVDPAALAAIHSNQPTFTTVIDPASHYPIRWFTVPLTMGTQFNGAVQVAQSLDEVQESLRRLLTILLLSIPLLIAMALFGGYWLATHALAPIDQITRTAQRISAEDLHARLNLPATDDELGRLAATLDGMLARLDNSFRRERQFVADASHELRTPLTAMEAILSVTRQRRRTGDEYEQALDDLTDTAQWMNELVESLLQLARTDGRGNAAALPVDLTTLLGDLADSFRPQVEAKGLTLTTTIPDGLQVMGDTDNLIRLFVNLLTNAIKYTEAGYIAINAEICAGNVVVSIADSGIGIAEEELPYVFDRFFRADAARGHLGVGLGLAIAHALAKEQGGAISVQSVKGEGSTFIVKLPHALPST